MTTKMIRLMLPVLAGLLLCGCVVTNQVLERQGTKALLKKDYPEARAKLQKAADGGSAYAQYYLGTMYLEGEGVEKNSTKAVELLTKAADQEQPDALLMLGLFHVYGDYVNQDPAQGAELIRRSALAENDVAMYYMGNLYAAGVGVEKDLKYARMWMYNAKEFGFPVEPELLTLDGLEALYPE